MRSALLMIIVWSTALDAGNCRKGKSYGHDTPAVSSNGAGKTPSKDSVEMLKLKCDADGKCMGIAICDPSTFNEELVKGLAAHLSDRFKEKKVVNVSLFVDRAVADAYIAGVRNLAEIQNDRHGWYYKNTETEFLLYFADYTKRDNPAKINLRDVQSQ